MYVISQHTFEFKLPLNFGYHRGRLLAFGVGTSWWERKLRWLSGVFEIDGCDLG